MSSEVAFVDQDPVPPPPPPRGGDLTVWAAEARTISQIAISLARTAFVPKSMQNRPEEVAGAILAGRELGLAPMSALRSIDLIEGTPAMRAHAMRGLVQSHGHEVWVEESTETRAVVCGRRRGSSNVQQSTWTADRAQKAGLAGRSNWRAHPGAMLVARATSELCRLIASDVLIGMPYSAEELADDGSATSPPPPGGAGDLALPSSSRAGSPATTTRTARRRTPPAVPVQEPELTEPQPHREPPEPDGPALPETPGDDWPPTRQPPERPGGMVS